MPMTSKKNRFVVPLAAAVALIAVSLGALQAAPRPPNVIIIFADDMGYADIGPFGAEGYTTPNLDRMAAEGMKFTDFYVGRSVCSPSRAALLTGCYPIRVGVRGNFSPRSKTGLHVDEMTIADLVKQRDYATAMYGKWHLGHLPQFLPMQQGFDEYYGLPYSNDMWPFHPDKKYNFPDLPLLEGAKILGYNTDQTKLTTEYTRRAVRFIEKNQDRPFFIYMPHAMPHVPLFVSDKFLGKTKRGLFGDVISEIDWSVGQILDCLKRFEIDQHTLVVFTSDNGPWLLYGDHGGSAKPLREGKGTMFEGGMRVPCVMHWPGHIPAGHVCGEVAGTIDLLPTIARLAAAELPKNKIDGRDIWPLMAGQPGAKSPHQAYYYYFGTELQAVRSGKWKLHFPHRYNVVDPAGSGGFPGRGASRQIGLALFDLENDVSETTDVAPQHPQIVQRLKRLAEPMRDDLGDSLTNQKGTGIRKLGQGS